MKLSRNTFYVAMLSLAGAFAATLARADFTDDKLPTTLTPAPTPRPKKENSTAPKKNEPKKTTGKTPTATPASGEQSGGLLTSSDVFAHDTNAPLTYESKSADGSRKSGILVLKEDVVIIQNELTLKSEQAELFTGPNSNTPQRVIARKNVQLDKKGLTPETSIHATADEIEYFVDTRKAVLRGRPKISKGKEMLRGEIIELDMATEAIRVKNPSGVVDPKASKNESKDGAGKSSPKPRN